MSETIIEWSLVFTFFLLIVGFMMAESAWLSRNGWAGFGKSLAFSALTNFIGLSIGFFVFFIILAVVLAMSLDGSITKFQLGDAGVGLFLLFGILFTPVLLLFCKRIFLRILKMQTGMAAWLFSLVSAILIVVVPLGLPILMAYFLYR